MNIHTLKLMKSSAAILGHGEFRSIKQIHYGAINMERINGPWMNKNG